jgi:hypothetical protein
LESSIFAKYPVGLPLEIKNEKKEWIFSIPVSVRLELAAHALKGPDLFFD